MTTLAGKIVRLSRLLLGAPSGLDTDHINGDTLDNRRSNLRLASRRQNMQNFSGFPSRRRSRFKGVIWHRDQRLRRGGQWVYQIRANGHRIVGYAKTEEEAAQRYNALARAHFGEFARIEAEP